MKEQGGTFSTSTSRTLPLTLLRRQTSVPRIGVDLDRIIRIYRYVDECSTELAGAYQMDHMGLFALFGHTPSSEITTADIAYNIYPQGNSALKAYSVSTNFNIEGKKSGQAQSRAHFVMPNCALRNCNGFMTSHCYNATDQLTIPIDRSRAHTGGKLVIRYMLL